MILSCSNDFWVLFATTSHFILALIFESFLPFYPLIKGIWPFKYFFKYHYLSQKIFLKLLPLVTYKIRQIAEILIDF